MKRFAIKTWFPVALVLGLRLFMGGQPGRAFAGENTGDLFNYSFAVWLGSGVYKVDDANKRLAVLRVPLRYSLREAQDYQLPFKDKIGFKLLLSAVLAWEEETETNDDFGAAAFVPGIEVQIPVNKYWTLKPVVHFGLGKDNAGGDLKYIYGGGLGSLIRIPWHKFTFSIGNSMILARDHNAASNDTNGFSMINAGLDVRHPTNLTLFKRQLDVSGFFIYHRFINNVDVLSEDRETSRIGTIYEAGMTFGVEKPVLIWKLDFDRVGFEYRWGDEAFKGFGVNLGFPF